jgi:hypothetical protein
VGPSLGQEWGVEKLSPGTAVVAVALVLSWLAWSVLVPRWRLWAYERVSDLGELKRLAVLSYLIWPEGSVFARTEIASKALRTRLRELERKHARGEVDGVFVPDRGAEAAAVTPRPAGWNWRADLAWWSAIALTFTWVVLWTNWWSLGSALVVSCAYIAYLTFGDYYHFRSDPLKPMSRSAKWFVGLLLAHSAIGVMMAIYRHGT